MFPSILTDVYKVPPELKPPTGPEILGNTDFPNTNSLEYRLQPIERTIKMHPIWERITINNQKNLVIGTNKGTGREWGCILWGFQDVNNLEPKTASFKCQVNSHVTNLAYLTHNLLIGTFRNGGVQLWSTYSEVRNPKQPHGVYNIGKRFEHTKSVECLEVTGDASHKAVTGGRDFTLKVWDLTEADIESTNTYHYAHTDTITGIADLQTDSNVFATCSRDRSVLFWDCREIIPASVLYVEHNVDFNDVIYAGNYHLYVGDESGNVHLIDKRVPNKFVTSERFFNRAIRKLALDNDNLAAIANSNVVKIYSRAKKSFIYENSKAHSHFVRDCVWYDSSKLVTVGCNSELKFHTEFNNNP